ncbi:MAG: hypothetical protein M1834_008498 [Cirrosporium novae-zelandiae]|nr:MAG: hypothetical protein M1834_008498 [Cirrosporium novae-zelandiae]
MASSTDQIYKEKQSCFRGTARIDLQHLQFKRLVRELDYANISRLINVFKSEQGCNRLEPEHHVPALINDEDLNLVLQKSNVSPTDLLKPQTEPYYLAIPNWMKLSCLHGRHRIYAARTFLRPGDQWWTVDLYTSDISDAVQTQICEEYANSKAFSDGDIYQKLRYYDRHGNKWGIKKWKARLSAKKLSNYRQLKKNHQLIQTFDALLPFYGLWPALKLGTLNRILPLHCQEEIIHYLELILNTWSAIICHQTDWKALVDAQTVEYLQCLAPNSCRADRTSVQRLMSSNKIFKRVKNPNHRSEILSQILNIPYIIPSLHTFQKNTIYLEPCAKIMKAMLPEKFQSSIQREYFKIYTSRDDLSERLIKEGSEIIESVEKKRLLDYHALWLFCMRHYPDMIGISPLRDPGQPKPMIKEPNDGCWSDFANLAFDLGFRSEKIREARHAPMHDTREYNVLNSPQLSVDTGGAPVDERCGMPRMSSYRCDKKYLFLKWMDYHPTESPREKITSFAVKHDIFHAFFGHEASPPFPSGNLIPETVSDIESLLDSEVPQEGQAFGDNEDQNMEDEGMEVLSGCRSERENEAAINSSLVPSNPEEVIVSVDQGPPTTEAAVTRQLRDLSTQCLRETQVAFFQFKTGRYMKVLNEENLIQEQARLVAGGHFPELDSKEQTLAILKNDHLKTVQVSKVYEMANSSDPDYERVIFFGGKNQVDEIEAFGHSFRAWCLHHNVG